MIDDDEVAVAAQPVGEDDAAGSAGGNFRTFRRPEKQSLPEGRPGAAAAEGGGDASGDRLCETALELCEVA